MKQHYFAFPAEQKSVRMAFGVPRREGAFPLRPQRRRKDPDPALGRGPRPAGQVRLGEDGDGLFDGTRLAEQKSVRMANGQTDLFCKKRPRPIWTGSDYSLSGDVLIQQRLL